MPQQPASTTFDYMTTSDIDSRPHCGVDTAGRPDVDASWPDPYIDSRLAIKAQECCDMSSGYSRSQDAAACHVVASPCVHMLCTCASSQRQREPKKHASCQAKARARTGSVMIIRR